MLLQPRKFKYKTHQKGRSLVFATDRKLQYGDSGLRLLQPLRLTGRRIFRLKIFLKKAVKKSDITKRKLWFNAFPHLPLTKKGKGLRMGKGIGKLNAWQIKLRGGVFLLEFRNLRPGRSVYFSKRIASKFPISVRWCFKNQTRITLNGARKVGIRPRNFY